MQPLLPTTHGMQHSCSHSNAICNHRFKKRIELRTQEQPLVAEHRGGTDWPRNGPNRTRRTHEVPFIAGCSHFTWKNTRFRAPASSPTQAPCNILCSHYNAFCSMTWLTRMHLRTWQHQMRTIMQPFQCDLQPQIQETNRTTHTGTTTRCRTQRRNRLTSKRSKPHPPHRGATFHHRLQPLYTEKMQGFVLRLPPQNKAHATFMQLLQYVSQHPVANLHLSTHTASPDDNNHAAIPLRSATTDSRNE